jgi:hypothetical protein
MKIFSKMLLLLIIGCFLSVGSAVAIPVTVNYTSDNVVVAYTTYSFDFPGDPYEFDNNMLGPYFDDWTIADTDTFEIPYGSWILFAFVAQNVGAPDTGNPGGLLAEISFGGLGSVYTSGAWRVSEGNFLTHDPMSFSQATLYGTNAVGDPNIWAHVPGISEDAYWIWTDANFADPDSPEFVTLKSPYIHAVPEPATMLLIGAGLLGIAAVGRKKLFK